MLLSFAQSRVCCWPAHPTRVKKNQLIVCFVVTSLDTKLEFKYSFSLLEFFLISCFAFTLPKPQLLRFFCHSFFLIFSKLLHYNYAKYSRIWAGIPRISPVVATIYNSKNDYWTGEPSNAVKVVWLTGTDIVV